MNQVNNNDWLTARVSTPLRLPVQFTEADKLRTLISEMKGRVLLATNCIDLGAPATAREYLLEILREP